MIELKSFTFNPFQENTYLLINDQKETLIVDPGIYSKAEHKEFFGFIKNENLRITGLLNTHCHLDHIFGNNSVHERCGVKPQIHKNEQEILDQSQEAALVYNLPFDESPQPEHYLEEGQVITIGETTLSVIWTPGHSPGSICFYCKAQNFLIGGDVLFKESIGRTDLPGGDAPTLIQSIKEKLYRLPNNTVVYPGHGPQTTIDHEKKNNPFVSE